MNNSFLGYSRKNKIPIIIKFSIFILINVIALLNFIPFIIKLFLIIILVILRCLLQNYKKGYKIYVFLFVSSIMIFLFWYIFENEIFLKESLNSISKLWLLLLSGNVLLLSISQNELVKLFLKYNVSENIILLIVVSLNSIAYFLESFKIILKSYEARNVNKNIIKKLYNCLITISIDTLFLLIECKNAYTIYYDQIMNSLKTKVV